MKIQELTGYRNTDIYRTAKDHLGSNGNLGKPLERSIGITKFKNFLVQQGFRMLGRGEFGVVFEKPGYPWLFKVFKDDGPYEVYIKWVLKNQNNPHVPRIRGGLMKINEYAYAIRMEKLTDMLPKNPDIVKLVNMLSKIDEPSDLTSNEIHWIDKNYPQLIKVLWEIFDIIENSTFSLDFNVYNIMLRGETPVITDPMVDVRAM